jgi:hypothetical protein
MSKHEQLKKKSAATALDAALAHRTPKWPSSEPHGANRQWQAIAETSATWSASQIPSAIVVFVVLVCKSHSQQPQEALNLSVTEDWAPFYMPLYTFLHNLLNVLVPTANRMGLYERNSCLNACTPVSGEDAHLPWRSCWCCWHLSWWRTPCCCCWSPHSGCGCSSSLCWAAAHSCSIPRPRNSLHYRDSHPDQASCLDSCSTSRVSGPAEAAAASFASDSHPHSYPHPYRYSSPPCHPRALLTSSSSEPTSSSWPRQGYSRNCLNSRRHCHGLLQMSERPWANGHPSRQHSAPTGTLAAGRDGLLLLLLRMMRKPGE